jgi:hypothetical protein
LLQKWQPKVAPHIIEVIIETMHPSTLATILKNDEVTKKL